MSLMMWIERYTPLRPQRIYYQNRRPQPSDPSETVYPDHLKIKSLQGAVEHAKEHFGCQDLERVTDAVWLD